MKIGKGQKIIHLFLMGSIRWRIKTSDPLKYAIKSLPGWFFLNPLCVVLDKSTPRFENCSFFTLQRDEIIISDNRLSFLVKNEVSFNPEIYLVIETYLRFFRNLSQQVTISADFAAAAEGKEVELIRPKEFIISKEFNTSKASIRKSYLNTSIDNLTLRAVLSKDVKYEFPIYHEIVLEAMAAYDQNDFRKAILYSTIAIETMANYTLESEYQKRLKSKNSHLRVINFNQGGGSSIKKDPVFEYLSEKSDFKQCLHERPLYLMKKSLLNDKESLYKRCIELYRVRNHLVHKGAPSVDLAFELDQANAEDAIRCAFSVFKWFGDKHEYVAPFDYSFIKLQELTPHQA